jgi:hypothetical protein
MFAALLTMLTAGAHRAAETVRLRHLGGRTIYRSKHWPAARKVVAVAITALAIAGLLAGQAVVIVAKMVWG